ncbi:MAG: UDP-N-acetylglucosamine 1-carboxyvinyltransferase [Verrucomicrobiota bacterium]|nr:UDP-N-acetylglucosamine 1-carboxyvinyltransferase [Verrucomicrobiota bacterium]
MSNLKIKGKIQLSGSITTSGNKNAVLPIIAASLLTDQEVTLNNVPDIVDVRVMLEGMKTLGCDIYFTNNQLKIKAGKIQQNKLSRELCSRIRTSILFVAPLLHRTGQAEISPPGGDIIGRRRLDAHFYGLQRLGTKLEVNDSYKFNLKDKMRGADLFFDEASVTATEHILTAAVLAEGQTVIRNAASEPHVQDLALFLQKMGADIKGINTNTLTVNGVKALHGTTHEIISDHIEAGSFLALTAATGGEITIKNTQKHHFWMIRRVFEKFGLDLEFANNTVRLPGGQVPKIQVDFAGGTPTVQDGPWPAFPSDLMSSMLVLATQSEGTVLFFEKMFESRMVFVDKLISMGTNAIICDPHRVVISGKTELRGINMSSPDIRAGMALISAALCAKGESIIQNAEIIDRGYENVEHKLRQLGADVVRI